MKDYLIIIIGVLLIISILILMIKFSDKFRQRAYKLFVIAENTLDKDKMEYVVNAIYEYLPLPLKILPPSVYQKILQKLFDEVHELLENPSKKKGV